MNNFILKYWIWLTLSAVSIAAAIFIMTKRKENPEYLKSIFGSKGNNSKPCTDCGGLEEEIPTSQVQTPVTNAAGLDMGKTLKRGMKNDEVRLLQSYLNNMQAGIDIDGIFGSDTAGAVRRLMGVNEISLEDARGKMSLFLMTGR